MTLRGKNINELWRTNLSDDLLLLSIHGYIQIRYALKNCYFPQILLFFESGSKNRRVALNLTGFSN